jgi:hypothetical protein
MILYHSTFSQRLQRCNITALSNFTQNRVLKITVKRQYEYICPLNSLYRFKLSVLFFTYTIMRNCACYAETITLGAGQEKTPYHGKPHRLMQFCWLKNAFIRQLLSLIIIIFLIQPFLKYNSKRKLINYLPNM